MSSSAPSQKSRASQAFASATASARRTSISVLQKTRQPFNANAIAQAGAIAGLLDLDHQEKTRATHPAGPRLLPGRIRRHGPRIRPQPGEFRDGESRRRQRQSSKTLMAKGVIVRAMASYRLPEWIRVSVGTDAAEPPLHRGAPATPRPRARPPPEPHRVQLKWTPPLH